MQIKELMETRPMLFGNTCMLITAFFWGANISVTKALIPDWMSAYGITVTRLVGGCILFWITSMFVKCEPIRKEDWLNIILGGAIGMFSFIFLFITSLRYGSAIDISIIMTLPPMFVILMGVLFMHQRPAILEYAGVLVSFIGAAIVILAGEGTDTGGADYLLGDMLALVSTICFAFYLVILEKPTPHYRPVNLLRWVFLFAGIPALLLIPGMQNEGIVKSFHIVPWTEILFILLFPTFAAYFLVQPSIKTIGAEMVSLYQYLIPIFAALTAVMLGVGEIRFSQILAMAVVIVGMVLTNIGKKKRKTPSNSQAAPKD